MVRDLAHELRAVRRRGQRLHTTTIGRALAADAEGLWRAVAGQLGSGRDFGAVVTELVLLVLFKTDGEVAESALVKRVAGAVVGEGWHERTTGQPPDHETVRSQVWTSLNPWQRLGLARRGGHWQTPTHTLTDVGLATALEALHARATGPLPDPRGA